MFSIRGTIIKGDDLKKNIILSITKDDFEKISGECNLLHKVFKTSNQPLYPAWKYQHPQDGEKFYAKLLLSKARKEQYSTLMAQDGERLFKVSAVPYSIENSNTGSCNGISLYYQGEYTAPKKFRVKQGLPCPENAAQEPLPFHL